MVQAGCVKPTSCGLGKAAAAEPPRRPVEGAIQATKILRPGRQSGRRPDLFYSSRDPPSLDPVLVRPDRPTPISSGFTAGPIGAIMSHARPPPDQDHLQRSRRNPARRLAADGCSCRTEPGNEGAHAGRQPAEQPGCCAFPGGTEPGVLAGSRALVWWAVSSALVGADRSLCAIIGHDHADPTPPRPVPACPHDDAALQWSHYSNAPGSRTSLGISDGRTCNALPQ
jgi:hypothetical protein